MQSSRFTEILLRRVWICCNNLFLEVTCENLDPDMFGPSEEEPLSDGGIEEDIFFLFREFEDILQYIDRCGRLLEKKLYGGIRHNRFPLRTSHKIFDILCDGCNPKTVFSSSFYKTEKELCTVFVLHDIPCFIYNKYTFSKRASCNIPYISEQHIHSNRTEDIIQITDRKYYESFRQINIGRFRKYSGKYSCNIFFESFADSFCTIHRLEYGIEFLHNRNFFSCYIII